MSIHLETATLVAIFVESILYGFFLFTFLFSTFIIWSRKCESPKTRRTNLKLFFVSVAMFIVASVHLGTALHRVLHAFVPAGDHNSPWNTLHIITTACYVSKTVAYALQIVLGDGFMIYRLYMVWCGNRLICFPAVLTFLCGIAASAGSIHHSATSSLTLDTPLFASHERAWVISSLSLALFTNAYSTALIAGRIWWVPHKIYGLMSHGGENQCHLGPAAEIVIESGIAYSTCMSILIALYSIGSYAQNIVLDAMPQIIGIVFSLIIVRVALGVSGATPVKRVSASLTLTTQLLPTAPRFMSRIHWPGSSSPIRTERWRNSSAHGHSLSTDMFHAARSNPEAINRFISISVTKSNDAGYIINQESTGSVEQKGGNKSVDQITGGVSETSLSVDHPHVDD